MRNLSLFVAGAVVLVANGLALTHAARNRTGEPDAELVLTNHELVTGFSGKENSGLELNLNWVSIGNYPFTAGPGVWLDRRKLSELGFDCSVDPASGAGDIFYRRQRARRAFAALEYNGPALKAWQDSQMENARRQNLPDGASGYANSSSLVLFDAASNPAELRRRHPDRASVMILPAVVRIGWFPSVPATNGLPKTPARVVGFVEMPRSLHVPRPFSDQLPAGQRTYRVHLSVGTLYDPWVTAVEPGNK